MRTLRVGILFLCGLIVFAPGAVAAEATSTEVRDLARRAVEDEEALEELQSIDRVDGREVDHYTAFVDAEGEQLETRLRSLSGDSDPIPPDRQTPLESSDVRREAREVLDQGKFEERDVPRPFRGLLDAIGGGLRRIWDWLVDLANGITGGNPHLLLWALLAGAAVLGVIGARRLIARRAGKARKPKEDDEEKSSDPRDLDDWADEAERNGDLEKAIRLRFRAGLVRLAQARVVPARTSLTSGDVARYLRSKRFEEVAATFDEVVYGRRTPRPEDVETTRAGWKAVLQEKTGA